MKKGQKFNSFYGKVVNYQTRKLSLTVKKGEKDKNGKFTKEYKTLLKAKKDILDKTKNTLDGALTFSEIVSYGELSKKAREQWQRTRELANDPMLEDYIFRDEKDEIKTIVYHQTQEFTMEVFDEKIIERLLNNIFFSGYSKKSLEKIQIMTNGKFENYKIDIAKEMAKRSINELKKHLPIKWAEFLTPKLDEALAICDSIDKSPKEIKFEQMQKQIVKNYQQK